MITVHAFTISTTCAGTKVRVPPGRLPLSHSGRSMTRECLSFRFPPTGGRVNLPFEARLFLAGWFAGLCDECRAIQPYS